VANIVFNIALGKVKYYAELPAANDGLVLIAAGVQRAGDRRRPARQDDDFASLVAGTTNEQTTVGRKALASVTVTVDNTNDRVALDAADVTWTSPTGNAIGAVVICYDPDTTTAPTPT
jgi:hypothetical protein